MKYDKAALRRSMLLYLVTDRTWLGENDLAAQVEESLRAGATFVQLREKCLDTEAFTAGARRIREVAARYQVPFVINDNIEVALASDADGVHVGQQDMAARDVRALIGPDKLLGVSASSVEQALAAEAAGADYIGVGAVFPTSTKPDAGGVSRETLSAVCAAVSVPVVAIGGITAENLPLLGGSGVDGVAVISAVFAQSDIAAATRRLHMLSKRMVEA